MRAKRPGAKGNRAKRPGANGIRAKRPRFNDPDLVQAFLKKWWVESDFKASNLPLSLLLKGSGCHYNSIYNNTGTK
jgi:hypothetical protein